MYVKYKMEWTPRGWQSMLPQVLASAFNIGYVASWTWVILLKGYTENILITWHSLISIFIERFINKRLVDKYSVCCVLLYWIYDFVNMTHWHTDTTRECVKTKTTSFGTNRNGFNIAKPNSLHKTNKFTLGTNKLAHNQQVLCWNQHVSRV